MEEADRFVLKKRILDARAVAAAADQKYYDLMRQCNHSVVVKRQFGGASCDTCGKDLGWWCPESKDHTCDYEQADGTHDSDSCRYCGEPSERK